MRFYLDENDIQELKELCVDSSLDDIHISYENIDIFIELENGRRINVTGEGFVAIDYSGNWDENVIKKIELNRDTVYIKHVLDGIKNRNDITRDGGGVGIRKFDDLWYELDIILIDDLIIKIVAQRFYVK